ncbi:PH domain-containing protein [Streptomyces sp. NPDC014894]|uniref:PH domain-containing protein n=1 Tax=Streptomyces sp. NPDC014894 TaxID=3364931 RepID=UPI0036FE5EB0
MNQHPLPLPPEHIPAGAAPWRSDDARRWAAAVPGKWAGPLYAAIALIAGAAWAIAWEPEFACTAARPCGTEWWGLAHFGLLLLCLYWIWRQPRLALAGAAALAATSLLRLTDADPVNGTGDSGFLAALGFVALTLTHRLAARRRQRALAEEAAGPGRHPLPEAADRFVRGRVSLIVAAVLFAVSAFALWQALGVVGAYEERAAAADRVSAQIVEVETSDEDLSPMVAESAGERRHRVETAFPEDYPVGTRVELAVDGDWIRLVSEPYDIFGWEMLLLAASVPGLAFLANGLTGHRRARALDGGRVPVLKVLLRQGDEDGRATVYAADDTAAERPLLTFHSLDATRDPEDDSSFPGHEEGMEQYVEEAEDRAGPEGDPEEPLREAILYGVPHEGAEVMFLAPVWVPDGEPVHEVEVERSVTPVRLAGRGMGGPFGSGKSADRRARTRRRPVDEIAAELPLPSAAPLSWSADRASRGVGLFLLLAQGGGVWALLGDGLSWQWILVALALPTLINSIATALNWRLTADRDGVWVAGPWRVRHIPWDSVIGVRHTPDSVEITLTGGKEIELSPVGFARLQTRLGRPSAALEAADALRALLHRPDLRPERNAEPSEQGMPLGPVIVVVAAVWAAVVVLLL